MLGGCHLTKEEEEEGELESLSRVKEEKGR